MTENEISSIVVNCAIKVHRELGPGLLESVYEICLQKELRKQGLQVKSQKSLGISYDGEFIPDAFRIDLLVEVK